MLLVAWGVGVAGAAWGAASFSALRRERAALADVTRAAKRLVAGETHVVAPGAPGGPGELAFLVNELGNRVRTEHIRIHPDRVFEQAMLRETPNGLMVVDGRGIIRGVNPAGRNLLDWASEPVGTVASASVPLPDLAAVLREAADSREVRERSTRYGARDLLVRGLPLADGGGTLGVVLDITSVVAAERVRREFVANVSHELRTPVTAIVGYAESLEDENLTPQARALLAPLVRNALRLSRLCEDVLALSVLEARAADFPTENVDIVPLLDEVVDLLRDTAAARKIRLRVDAPGPTMARLNAEAFTASLQNLVDNALKYTPEGGDVQVRVSVEGKNVDVAVVDTGPGIAPEHHSRLFERFYRVDAGRSRDAGGTGLGLALVKHYCRAMGADVSMQSTPGTGSTFTLHLPAADLGEAR